MSTTRAEAIQLIDLLGGLQLLCLSSRLGDILRLNVLGLNELNLGLRKYSWLICHEGCCRYLTFAMIPKYYTQNHSKDDRRHEIVDPGIAVT